VRLTPEVLSSSGIQTARAQTEHVPPTIALSGSVGANEDRTVHLNPKVEGLVRKVLRTLGDRVKEGDPLVTLDSTAMGNAKVEFLKLLQEVQMARTDLERKAAVQHGITTMLELLEKNLDPRELERRTDKLALGEFRSRLLTSYSTARLARATVQREERLFQRRVSSQKELLEARRDDETARAQLKGAMEEAKYSAYMAFLTATKTTRTHEAAYNAALRQLEVLGTSEEERWALREGKATDLALFTVRAPISGTITEKHVTLGERVTPETSMMTLVDLSSLWVRAEAHEKDLATVYVGMPAQVEVGAYPGRAFPGKLTVISPVIDPKTRTAHLRVEVDNAQGLLSLGMFAKIQGVTAHRAKTLAIPITALQSIRGKNCVFVREAELVFRPQEVKAGVRNVERGLVEVLEGLKETDEVVIDGAFFLKSELLKDEAGHDHAH
jgi:membrane fusion protein, heavy metal efflux system